MILTGIKHSKAYLGNLTAIFLALFLLGACAGGAQQQQEDDGFGQEENNYGDDEEAGFDDEAENEDYADEEGEGNDGEALNNATENNFSDNNGALNDEAGGESGNQGYEDEGQGTGNQGYEDEGQGTEEIAGGENDFLNQGDQADLEDGGQGVNNALVSEEDFGENGQELEQPAVDNYVNENVQQAAAQPPMQVQQGMVPQQAMASQVAAGQIALPMAGGVVRYVTSDGASVYDQPGNGTVVGKLEQGEHPLVTESGEWARTNDGLYIQTVQLSESPIGRRKIAKDWN